MDEPTCLLADRVYLMVDLAGVEPASRMPSLWRNYNNFLFRLSSNYSFSHSLNCLWLWRLFAF